MEGESILNANPNSKEFSSMHIESLKTALESLDVNDEHGKVKMEIELSKEHWSELASSYYTPVEDLTVASSSSLSPSSYYTPAEGLTVASSSSLSPHWVYEEGTPERKLEVAKDNVDVFRSLQKKYPGKFFIEENDFELYSSKQFSMRLIYVNGRFLGESNIKLNSKIPFAEGGQGKLFRAHFISNGEKLDYYVVKVFKEEMPFRDLFKRFSTMMLANDKTCKEGFFGDAKVNFNPIFGVRLLKSIGKIAFVMVRAWGDLRKLINKRMLHFNTQSAPFPNDVVFYIIHKIAKGMMELHERGIVHRDLKASNILVFQNSMKDDFEMDLFLRRPHEFTIVVADYECSIGVVGTKFWRAPEVLEALKNRTIFQKLDLFNNQVDVYSFGITCYEVLSGGLPLEELQAKDYDAVIQGMRPMLPSQTPSWMVDLVNRCWHKDPSMRPPFQEIMKILEPYVPK